MRIHPCAHRSATCTQPIVLLILAACLAIGLAPRGAAADTLFVGNWSENAIRQFTPAGHGSVFATGMSSPYGLAFDQAGNLFVANAGTDTIVKIAPDGKSCADFASTITDYTSSQPTGLAFDHDGDLYALLASKRIILKFAPDGSSSVFASTGLNSPYGLTFDHQGNLFVANLNNTIEKFSPAGVDLGVFASTLLNYPLGLAVDSKDNLYVANLYDKNVVKFTPAGVGGVFATGFQSPAGVLCDSADNLYVTDWQGKIMKYTPAGVPSVFAADPGDYSVLSTPMFMAFSPVPEPGSAALLGLGALALLGRGRRGRGA